jgi:hypothetical protein
MKWTLPFKGEDWLIRQPSSPRNGGIHCLKEYKRTRQHINFTAEDFNLITENTYNRFEKTE